ncbi:MAG: hypothetical protein M3R25_06420 [Bacteroidota bacterium]|nr:hypothetical protein [Bacteroidota bacterium]
MDLHDVGGFLSAHIFKAKGKTTTPSNQDVSLAKRLLELNVPTQTIIEKNGEHDEITIKNNLGQAIFWFDKYLK